MKFLTDTLTFPLTALGGTKGDTIAYTIEVSDLGGTVITSYDGVAYYHSDYQTIDYSHLLGNIRIESAESIGRVTVDLISSVTNASVADEDIILCERTFGIPDGITATDYTPSGARCLSYILPSCVERPMVAIGQTYPLIVWPDNTHDFSGETITGTAGEEYNLEDYSTGTNVLVLGFIGTATGTHIESDTGLTEIDTLIAPAPCSATHMLCWYDSRGFFQSRPFFGNMKVSYEHHNITDVRGVESRIDDKVERTWSLQSSWVHLQSTYESLLSSKYVMLYDCVSGETWRVLVTDSDYQYTRSKDPFRFNVNLKYDRTYYSR